MLDELPLEVVARGNSEDGVRRLFWLSHEVSKQCRNTVQASRRYAKRFELSFDLGENVDVASPEKIVNQWFTNRRTYPDGNGASLKHLPLLLGISGIHPTDEDVPLFIMQGITDVSALGVHNLTLDGCKGITHVLALGGVHNLTLRLLTSQWNELLSSCANCKSNRLYTVI